MAESDVLRKVAKRLAFEKSHIKRSSRKFRRNITRSIRRKKSKWRISQQRRDRNLRIPEELCAAVSVVGISDMDGAQTDVASFSTAFTEVSEWQKQHQIAYWKSRALSLEYENKMLHQHIRHVYAKQIIDYQNAQYLEENCTEEEEQCDEIMEQETVVKREEVETTEDNSAPSEQVGKRKKEEMVRLYGEMAPKIIGMETAVQLNYDIVVDKHNPSYWPNIPLNFKNN